MERNVVVVCLDTVRKDYFDRFATRLSDAATVSYEQCRAASSWSTPSHASMLTGELPTAHGVHTHNTDFSTLSPAETVFGDLSDHTAIGVSANFFASPRYGFDELFDRFTAVDPDVLFQEAWDPLDVSADGVERYLAYVRAASERGQLGKYAANFLAYQLGRLVDRLPVTDPRDKGARAIADESLRHIRATDGPFVLFTNFMDAHQPHYPFRGLDDSLYDVAPSWSSAEEFHERKWSINMADGVGDNEAFLDRFTQLYGASVEYLDRAVMDFLDRVRAVTDRETTVVITADHGENLAGPADEHMFEHTSSLSEGLLHVPLVVVNAPVDAPMRVTDYVSHLQLPELVAGLARGDLPDVTRDRVAGEVVGLAPGGADFDADERRYYDRLIRAAYDGDRKYVWDSLGDRTVYELDADRPCWQAETATPTEPPAWKSTFFPEPASDVKERCARGEPDRPEAVGQFAETRLRDLGYL